jgi:hypothetical protein
MDKSLVWAAAVSVSFLPMLYSQLALAPLLKACSPPDLYWRRRLRLNLMEANLGMFLNLGLALAAAMLLRHDNPAAWPIICLAACVQVVYTVFIVVLTPRDWWHALPTGIAALCYAAAYVASG